MIEVDVAVVLLRPVVDFAGVLGFAVVLDFIGVLDFVMVLDFVAVLDFVVAIVLECLLLLFLECGRLAGLVAMTPPRRIKQRRWESCMVSVIYLGHGGNRSKVVP